MMTMYQGSSTGRDAGNRRVPLRRRLARTGTAALMALAGTALALGTAAAPATAITPPEIPVGLVPFFSTVDPATNTVYVANAFDNTVSVIDGSTCGSLGVSGCAAPVATAPVGLAPIGMVIDDATDTLYVANFTGFFGGVDPEEAATSSLSMIDLTTCNAVDFSGCGGAHPTAAAGIGPVFVALDPTSRTVYVSNYYSFLDGGLTAASTVSMIDADVCNATDQSGCLAEPTTTTVGRGPAGMDIDVARSTLYVANYGFLGTSDAGDLTLVDTAACNARTTSGCATSWPTAEVGVGAFGVRVSPAKDTVYVSDASGLVIVRGSTCNAADSSGCAAARAIEGDQSGLALALQMPLDPATGTLYVTGFVEDPESETVSGTVRAVDGATCRFSDTSGCAASPTIPISGPSYGPSLNPVTGTLYVPLINFGEGFGGNGLVAVLFRPSLSGAPPAAELGAPYSFAFSVDGAPDPTVSVTTGTLPPGLTLSAAGVLSGTPTAAGSYPVTLTAANGIAPDATLAVTLTVAGPTFSVADVTLTEGNGGVNTPKLAKFAVTRGGDLSAPASVRFHTESGTSGNRAIKEVDFKSRDTIVQFPAGVATVLVEVKIVGDRVTEPNEQFRAVLDKPTGGLEISRNVALGTIIDDDGGLG